MAGKKATGRKFVQKKEDIKKQVPGKENTKLLEILQTVLFIGVLIAIFYPPYLRGLFFERELLWAEIIVFVLFTLYWILKSMKKDGVFLKTPLDYAVLAFCAVYFIAMIGAASFRLAFIEWLKYCMFFAVFLMVSDFANTHRKRMTFLWILAVSGTGVALLGIDGAAGEIIAGKFNNFFKVILGIDYDVFFGLFVSNRVFSTMQYPNALAGFLMAIFFVILAIIAGSEKPWQKTIAGCLGFILMETFILTLSRGAYLVFGIAVILYFIVLPKGTRIRNMALMVPPVAVSALVYLKLQDYIAREMISHIWLAVAAGIIATGILMLVVHLVASFLERLRWKAYAVAFSIILFVEIAGAIYVLTAYEPLTLMEPESVTRSVSLKPGEYTLALEMDAENKGDRPYAANIRIASLTEENILFGGSTVLINENIVSTNGITKEQYTFTVPEESRIVNLVIRNGYEDTSVTVNSARIIYNDNSKFVKDIKFAYKYIPENIIRRFQGLFSSKSFLQRIVYYKDGLSLFASNWFKGAGGGAWSLLYFQHQSYLYWSTLAHNFWLQLAIETGILGIGALVYFLLVFFGLYIIKRNVQDDENSNGHVIRAALFTSALALLGHSAIDFDLSLTSIFLVLWVVIAVFNSYYRHDGSWKVKLSKKSNIGGNAPDGKSLKILKKLNIRSFNTSPAVMVVISIAILVVPVLMKAASICAEEAIYLYNIGFQDEGAKLMKEAVGLEPFSPMHKIDYANMVLNKEHDNKELVEAIKQIDKAERQSRNDAELLTDVAVLYSNIGWYDRAMDAINRTTVLRPLWEGTWQQKAAINYNIAMYLFGKGETGKAMPYVNNTVNIINEAKAANESNMDPFIFEVNTMSMIEKMQYIIKERNVNPEFVVFYNIPSMDVNADGIPDQWTIVNAGDLSVTAEGDAMTVSNASKGQYLRSRKLILEPGKPYSVYIEAEGSPVSVAVAVNGITDKMSLEADNGVYSLEFTAPDEPGDNVYMKLFIEGELRIDKLMVREIRRKK